MFVGLFGLCISSFLNVVIYRLPNNMNICKPASHCPKCKYELKWYDNIPIISYLILGGKCRSCKERIIIRYVLVEVVGMSLVLLCFVKFGLSLNFFIASILSMVFICIFFIDLKHYIIPDSLNLTILILGIVSLFTSFNHGRFNIGWADKLTGFGIGIGLILLVFIIEKLLKKEIIGGGDLKLITAIGLVLGWELTILGILLCSIYAGLVEIPLSLNKKLRQDHRLPFGPYLVLGFLSSMMFGLELLEWYLSMFF